MTGQAPEGGARTNLISADFEHPSATSFLRGPERARKAKCKWERLHPVDGRKRFWSLLDTGHHILVDHSVDEGWAPSAPDARFTIFKEDIDDLMANQSGCCLVLYRDEGLFYSIPGHRLAEFLIQALSSLDSRQYFGSRYWLNLDLSPKRNIVKSGSASLDVAAFRGLEPMSALSLFPDVPAVQTCEPEEGGHNERDRKALRKFCVHLASYIGVDEASWLYWEDDMATAILCLIEDHWKQPEGPLLKQVIMEAALEKEFAESFNRRSPHDQRVLLDYLSGLI